MLLSHLPPYGLSRSRDPYRAGRLTFFASCCSARGLVHDALRARSEVDGRSVG